MNDKRRYCIFFLIMFVLTIIGAITSLVSPVLLSVWGEQGRGISGKQISILTIVMLCAMVFEVLITVFRERFAKQYNKQNFRQFIELYFDQKYDVINDQGPSEFVQRIQQAVNNLYEFMTGDCIKIWSSIIILVVISVIMIIRLPFAGVLIIAAVPVNYWGYRLLNNELKMRSKELQEKSAKGYSQVISIVGQTDYVKQCSDCKSMMIQLEPAMELLYGSMANINVVAKGGSKIIDCINNIIRTIVLALTVYQVTEYQNSPLLIIMTASFIPLFFSSISTVTNANLNKNGFLVSQEFIEEMKRNVEKDGTKELVDISQIKIGIDSLKVEQRELARNIRGEYGKGDIVWIRGESGKGKSSLAKLLVKFRETDGIYYNDVRIDELRNSCVRKRVTYMSQNVPIIKGTLRDNIFFNKKYDPIIEKKIMQEPIMKGILEGKSMDDDIEENGANLSGGEKQKIAIARTLFDDSDVLILDEITSNIDKKTAEAIMEQIIKKSKDKIIFVISHDELPEKYATKCLEL